MRLAQSNVSNGGVQLVVRRLIVREVPHLVRKYILVLRLEVRAMSMVGGGGLSAMLFALISKLFVCEFIIGKIVHH